MERDIERLKRRQYDLLVIGGGINGAAIANIAAGRGMQVALIEKGDFASGTSSKSSKLIHGGIRYLENFQFPLVYEALRERCFHLRETPHRFRAIPVQARSAGRVLDSIRRASSYRAIRTGRRSALPSREDNASVALR